MTLEPSDLVQRLSGTLRNEVAPTVTDEYTKTQTHMASVILSKLAKQLALEPAHGAAERSDVAELHRDLAGLLAAAPPEVAAAAATAADEGTVPALAPLIDALYRWGTDGDDAARALARIRVVLRNDIDRRMEIAR